jgi:hypothetical protein
MSVQRLYVVFIKSLSVAENETKTTLVKSRELGKCRLRDTRENSSAKFDYLENAIEENEIILEL